jgi:hypothetical protein
MCDSSEIYANTDVSFSVNGNGVSLSDDTGGEPFAIVPHIFNYIHAQF